MVVMMMMMMIIIIRIIIIIIVVVVVVVGPTQFLQLDAGLKQRLHSGYAHTHKTDRF
jgi:hypothetical protein